MHFHSGVDTREFGNEGLLRGIIIEVDKKRCAKVGLNGRAECSITSSRHSIRARMDRVKSSPIEIMVKDGDLVGFVCRSTSAQILLRRTFHKTTPGLRQAADAAAASAEPHARGANTDQQEHSTPSTIHPLVPWNVVLEVSINASQEEISDAYRQRMKEYHPDKVAFLGREIRDVAERRSKEINNAYS